MTTTIERDGPVTTIVRARTHARNAMDPASAEALVEALLAFDRDPRQSVAVLWGAGRGAGGGGRAVRGRVRPEIRRGPARQAAAAFRPRFSRTWAAAARADGPEP